MPSRLLGTLDARIAKSRDPLLNTCARAERAALFARQGRLDDARAELAAIHARYDGRPSAAVSAWTSLAEGLVAFHGDLGSSARDKLLRSHALASAAGERRVRALSAAWLAHMNYLEDDFEPMVRHLGVALTEAPPDSGSALARACLVTAQSYHWADRVDLAQPWYARARRHATDEGDETLLSALMHNMAWLRATQARRLAVSGTIDHEQLRQVLLGADSTGHFDQRIGTASLLSLVPILRAHVLTLLDRHAEALELFDAHWATALAEGLATLRSSMLAETAWCRARLGDLAGARRDALEARSRLDACVQPGDRAATHGRLAQVSDALGEPAAATHHRRLADTDWQAHAERQRRLLALLASVPALAA
jgi:hypothetical protein